MLWTLEIDMCCDLKKEQNDEHIKQYAELFLSLPSQGFMLITLDKEKDISAKMLCFPSYKPQVFTIL